MNGKHVNYLSNTLSVLILGFLTISIAGCFDNRPDNEKRITDELRELIVAKNVSANPAQNRILPSIDEPIVQLGKKLYFTKMLGGDYDAACVSCHHPYLGGGDGLSLSIGTGAVNPDLLGPGREHNPSQLGGTYDSGPTVPRNAPTIFNIGLLDSFLFHDGRIESLGKTYASNGNDGYGIRTPDTSLGVADELAGTNLPEAQSRFPVTSPEEMLGFQYQGSTNEQLRSMLAERLSIHWSAEFEAVFGDTAITYERIAQAIGEYQRSMILIDNPWKDFVEGNDAAITEFAKRGALLFYKTVEEGGANCASCHEGASFTDEQFHVLATPQIGRGKGDNNGITLNDDFGRSRETGKTEDNYKFRTLSLLNVEVTGPWGHAGGYTQLEDMVVHMLDPHAAIANYDFSKLDANIQVADFEINTRLALSQLEINRTNGVDRVHTAIQYTEADVYYLVEFLKTLTDPCTKNRNCLDQWVAGDTDTDPDGMRLKAIIN